MGHKNRRASRVLPVLALKTPRPPSKGGLLRVASQALMDRINKRIADFHSSICENEAWCRLGRHVLAWIWDSLHEVDSADKRCHVYMGKWSVVPTWQTCAGLDLGFIA